MTTEQVSIDDKNRTIAIFMELYCEKTTDFSNREIDAWYDKKTNIKKYEGRLQYHSDWNAIMPVYIKFRDMPPKAGSAIGFYNLIGEVDECLIRAKEPKQLFLKLYQAILWYNQHAS